MGLGGGIGAFCSFLKLVSYALTPKHFQEDSQYEMSQRAEIMP